MKEQMLGYAIVYMIYGGVVIGYALAKSAKLKRQLKKEEKRDLRRKAEAKGWNIVECEYTIEAI